MRAASVRRATRRPARVTVAVTRAGAVRENVRVPAFVRRGVPSRGSAGARVDGAPGFGADADGAAVVALQPPIVTGTLPVACSPSWLTNEALTGNEPHVAGVSSS